MLQFGRLSVMDSMVYGTPAQKHLDVIDRQMGDVSTALGRFVQHHGSKHMVTVIPPPPRNSSNKTMMELNAIVQRMAESTPEEREYAIFHDKTDNHYEMWAVEASRITGKKYDYSFFKELSVKVEGLIDYLKVYYNRPRPYQLAPEYGKKIVRITPDPRTASYPSGHSFDARTFCTVLCEKHPEHTEHFCAIANRISDSRMVAGVHFPSDLDAGRKTAEWTVRNLIGKV